MSTNAVVRLSERDGVSLVEIPLGVVSLAGRSEAGLVSGLRL